MEKMGGKVVIKDSSLEREVPKPIPGADGLSVAMLKSAFRSNFTYMRDEDIMGTNHLNFNID